MKLKSFCVKNFLFSESIKFHFTICYLIKSLWIFPSIFWCINVYYVLLPHTFDIDFKISTLYSSFDFFIIQNLLILTFWYGTYSHIMTDILQIWPITSISLMKWCTLYTSNNKNNALIQLFLMNKLIKVWIYLKPLSLSRLLPGSLSLSHKIELEKNINVSNIQFDLFSNFFVLLDCSNFFLIGYVRMYEHTSALYIFKQIEREAVEYCFNSLFNGWQLPRNLLIMQH